MQRSSLVQDNAMNISVIIINYNTRDLLLECIRSVTSQKRMFKMEVIVVDNGSTDGSQHSVRVMFPEVQVIQNNTNLGFSKANNIGILKSSGRYVCLVNSDVRVIDNCLQRLMTYMDNNLSIGLIGPKILNPDMTLQVSCKKFPSHWNNFTSALGLNIIFTNSPFFSDEDMRYFKHDKIQLVDWLAGCVLFVRRTAINDVGLLDDRFFIYLEEVDWCKRFKQHGWNVLFYPGAVAIHHHGASTSKDPTRFALEHQKAFLKYWKKHNGLFSVMLIHIILLLNYVVRIFLRGALYCLFNSLRPKLGHKIKIELALLSALLN